MCERRIADETEAREKAQKKKDEWLILHQKADEFLAQNKPYEN